MEPRCKLFRLVWLPYVAVAAVFAAIAWIPNRPDPVRNGIRLSEMLGKNFWWHGREEVGAPAVYTRRELECLRAFHSMGEAAWPVQSGEWSAQDSKLKARIMRLRCDWMPAWVPDFIPVVSASTRRARAIMATFDLVAPRGAKDGASGTALV